MGKKVNNHTKKKLNTKLQIVIMQTTKNPISISLSKTLGKFLGVVVFVFLVFSVFIFIDNRSLKTAIYDKNKEIATLKHESSLREKENTQLKSSLEEKNNIIQEKTTQLEQQLEDINNFQQTIRDFVGLGQGGSDVSSRNLSTRLKVQGIFENKLKNLGIDVTDVNSINDKLNEYEKQLNDSKEELDNLYNEVEARMDYLESVPNFFPTTGRITSYFGYRKNPLTYKNEFHHGLDIANYSGTNIMAAGKGYVYEIGYTSLFGNYIVIDHGYNYVTRYAHLSKVYVKKGEKIDKGQLIALMGSTGMSTGPHLHFEIRINDDAINPLEINENYN